MRYLVTLMMLFIVFGGTLAQGDTVPVQPPDDLDAIASVPAADEEVITLTLDELQRLRDEAVRQVNPIPDIVINGLLMLAGLGVVAFVIDALKKSAPPSVVPLIEQLGKTINDFALTIVEQKRIEAAQNDIDWDDPIWDTIYRLHKGDPDQTTAG